jgi:flagellar biosynthetic protein FliP
MNGLDLQLDGIGSISAPLQIVLLLTLLSFVPAILITMTAFTRIVIVFHFLRQALGTQETPSNQILIGLSLFLTMFIMAPVADRVYSDALEPAMAGTISVPVAMEGRRRAWARCCWRPEPRANATPFRTRAS